MFPKNNLLRGILSLNTLLLVPLLSLSGCSSYFAQLRQQQLANALCQRYQIVPVPAAFSVPVHYRVCGNATYPCTLPTPIYYSREGV